MFAVQATRVLRSALLALAAFAASGCAVAGHHSSPWEFGGGVRVAPQMAETESGLTLHPMASYTYLSWDGGHDNLWEVGGQVRKPVGTVQGHPGFWLGGEAALSLLQEKYSAAGFSSSSSNKGFSITGLAGFPVGQSRWGFNLVGGAGVSHYGSTGVNVRVGVDLQPWFLNP